MRQYNIYTYMSIKFAWIYKLVGFQNIWTSGIRIGNKKYKFSLIKPLLEKEVYETHKLLWKNSLYKITKIDATSLFYVYLYLKKAATESFEKMKYIKIILTTLP